MRIFQWLLFFLPFYSLSVVAQITYIFENDISVTEDNVVLNQPFSGGFVAPQYSTIDLNLDGIDDLFIFERSSGKVTTYLLIEGKYVYAPQYESQFPAGLKNWVLLRDFNCDGKQDLFTSSIFGMSLYENTSDTGLKWTLKHQTIFTEGSNGQTNLQISGLDLPAIVDVDNDGDLDILNFNFARGGGIEFHKNMSIENTGVCDLELVRTTKRYGDFEECTCETYVFGVDECTTGGREEHSGGKTILSFYNSNQLTQDLVIGQEYCLLPGYLPNSGTVDIAKMNTVLANFPDVNQPLRIEYPAFYEVDLYNNGSKELVAAPNSYVPDGFQNYEELSYLYKKNNIGGYSLVTNKFLKDQMIDVGHKASPVFVDIDFDGDEDLLIGTGKIGTGASIWFYKNLGSSEKPSFELITKDFLAYKTEGLESIRLQTFDVDDDHLPDLIVEKVAENDLVVDALIHTSNPITPYGKSNAIQLSLPALSIWDSPHYFNLGNKIGLLIGKQVGNLEYYTNSGSIMSPNWQLVSSSYLGIEEDFNKRNLRVLVADFNANGTFDMLSVNDSGEIFVYENFVSENTPQEIKGYVAATNNSFNLHFGKLANPVVCNLFGNLEPALAFGLLQGGINLLKNTRATDNETTLSLKVVVYPNPVENYQVLLQSNKAGSVRVLDVTGKVVINEFELNGGEQVTLQLILQPGVYFIEVISLEKEKIVNRIVILD